MCFDSFSFCNSHRNVWIMNIFFSLNLHTNWSIKFYLFSCCLFFFSSACSISIFIFQIEEGIPFLCHHTEIIECLFSVWKLNVNPSQFQCCSQKLIKANWIKFNKFWQRTTIMYETRCISIRFTRYQFNCVVNKTVWHFCFHSFIYSACLNGVDLSPVFTVVSQNGRQKCIYYIQYNMILYQYL